MLEIQNLYCGYTEGNDILKGICLYLEAGEILCLVGPNGCGKSTLLKAAARLLPFRGSVKILGKESGSCSRKELARRIAFLGQSSTLFFPYTVYETAAMGRYAYGRTFFGGLSRTDRDIIDDVLDTLELSCVRDSLISELSGGQLQRVFLARTIIQNPDIILLDEPTNHLDMKHQIGLLEYLGRWTAKENKAAIAVLHDLNMALHFGKRAVLMCGGILAAQGPVENVFTGDALEKAYSMDIRGFMTESLEKWKKGV
ncbi:MAG: ABC transporter ATP-binding protein [Treponema sp.]|jgi:iron complex transport system ATP-binding protein|nr:ABC transporter ATP-binding protein [Treponema sp.]